MSEYQHYDFQAVDRSLTAQEVNTLRRYSSRARITPTRFVNEYSYGNFKGDSSEWMEKYFDAFLAGWVTALPEEERTAMLVRVASGCDGHVRAELLRRFRGEGLPPSAPREARTAGALLAAASERAEERRHLEAAAEAREQARQERAAAEARARRLEELSRREAAAWREVDALIDARQPRRYDEAVELLRELRDLCQRDGRLQEARSRLAALRTEHEKKARFVDRLRAAGLLA